MKTVLNLKIDKATKQDAAQLAEKMGLSLSAVVHGLLRNFIQTQELHITAAPRMTPYLEGLIREAKANSKGDSPAFSSSKQAAKWLRGK